jgi:hypothetical protein
MDFLLELAHEIAGVIPVRLPVGAEVGLGEEKRQPPFELVVQALAPGRRLGGGARGGNE